MEEHLGYGKSERSDNDDYRNGYKRKRVNSSYGAIEYTGALKVPVRCFGNQLSGKGKSSFRTDNEYGGAASLKDRIEPTGQGRQLVANDYSLSAGSNPYTSLIER